MTAEEYRAILAELGLTQSRAARLLGVNPRTSRRWASGEQDLTPPVSRFLRFLAAGGISADRVFEILDNGGEK